MHPAASRALFDSEVTTLSPALAKRRGWRFGLIEFPIIECTFIAPNRTPLRADLACDDWNDQPPSITLRSDSGSLLQVLPPNPTGIFHPGPHPSTGLPFICMRGSREYHRHTSHLTDPWEPLRTSSSYTLGGILTQIWNAWQKGTG
jgi:hypothetical protein